MSEPHFLGMKLVRNMALVSREMVGNPLDFLGHVKGRQKSEKTNTITHHVFPYAGQSSKNPSSKRLVLLLQSLLGVERALHVSDWLAQFHASSVLGGCITRVIWGVFRKTNSILHWQIVSISTGKGLMMSFRSLKVFECFAPEKVSIFQPSVWRIPSEIQPPIAYFPS